MISNRTMSTQQIKKGLQNIKRAQLQVLKQLRGDSFVFEKQQRNINLSSSKSSKIQNNQNQASNANLKQKKQLSIKNQRQAKNERSFSKISSHKDDSKSINKNETQSLRTNESLSSNSSSTDLRIESIKKQFSSQRQELKNQLTLITKKLNNLQKQSLELRNKNKIEQHEIQITAKQIENENKELKKNKKNLNQKIQQSINQINKLKSQLEVKKKQKSILQTQIKSFQAQNLKLTRINKELQNQLKQSSSYFNKLYKTQKQTSPSINTKINYQLLISEIKSISSNHSLLFDKLKQSTKVQMSWVQKQSEIQGSFSRILQYLQNVSSNSSNSASANYLNLQNGYQNNRRSRQANINVKGSLMISESRDESREQYEEFVKEIGSNNSMSLKKQLNELRMENESLRKRVNFLTMEMGSLNQDKQQNRKGSKQRSESNRLISLQLEQMREEIFKLKRYKQQLKIQHEELQKELQRYKIKCRQHQITHDSAQRKISQITNQKNAIQKKCQQYQIEIVSLNSIIKQLNQKLIYNSGQKQQTTISHLRQQFTKLLQTNSLIIRQKQSIKAMNEGLQVQIHNLKYQKEQYETNNKQKHQLIERQIKQRNHLLQQINKKQFKLKQAQQEIQKLKGSSMVNEQQGIKIRKHLESLLDQKNQEVLQLRKQIEELYKQSREYHQLKFQHQKLQSQFKQLSRKSARMGQTLTHLWSVKQAEYHNVHQILGSLRAGSSIKGQQNFSDQSK